MEFKDEIQQIESLVLKRELSPARKAIAPFLRRHLKRQPELVFRACDWYRRLGLHELGYRLLAPDEPLARRISTHSLEGRRVLWAARFLNLMGATEFAVTLLSQIAAETDDDHRIIGSIYLASFDYALARDHLEKMRELDPDSSRYSSRLAAINLADAYSGLSLRSRALQIADEIFLNSTEPLLKAIALTAKGEYLAREGRAEEALVFLNQAQGFFPKYDRSPDYGLHQKWLGFAQGQLKNAAGALRHFENAREILRGTSLRSEAWMDVLRLQAECGLLDSRVTTKLKQYPGVAPVFGKQLGSLVGDFAHVTDGSAEWRIDLGADEFWHQGKPSLGVPDELRVLAWLRLAGEWGIPVVRLKSLLWPDQVYSYLYLENRLHQLIHRLRHHYDFEIELSDRLIRLGAGDLERVRVMPERDELRPSFLLQRESFTRKELQEFYSLTTTPAWEWIQEWLDRGWIQAKGKGRLASYVRC